ncbi:hypothetical protein DFQ26_006596 [Actinomortierella ambigua]|nr:hypothetical protein DFQ26_006596 [Actinomortierella ambigua]
MAQRFFLEITIICLFSHRQHLAKKDAPPVTRLGGTVTLTASAVDMYKIECILGLLVFALCHLQLEANLLRDHQSTRPDPSVLQTTTTLTGAQTAPVDKEDKHGTATSKRASIGSFLSWISWSNPVKYKRGTFQLAQETAPRTSILPNRANGASSSSVANAGRVIGGSGGGGGGGGGSSASSIAEDFGMTDDYHSPHSYRFAKIVQQIEKAIISVSPDTAFPPPQLLLRLRDEEASSGTDPKRKSYTWEDIEFVANKIGFGNRMSRISLAPGQASSTATATATAVTKKRMSSMLTHGSGGGGSNSSSHGQQPSNSNNNSNSVTTNNNKVARLPIDSRAGFDHLVTNNNSLQGIFNHQSISFSYSYFWSATAAAPCKAPHLITIEFYRKQGEFEDMSLWEMIDHLCRRAYTACSEPSCGHKKLEHMSSYTHGEARVNITVEEPRSEAGIDFESAEFAPFLKKTGSSSSSSPSLGLKSTVKSTMKSTMKSISSKATTAADAASAAATTTMATATTTATTAPPTPGTAEMAVWTRCKTCKARTTAHALSLASKLYSFGKYLEILLYCSTFEPGPRPLCEHSGYKDEITRCFLYNGLVVNFDLERIDLFEMRIPRLQVRAVYPAMPRYHEIEPEEEEDDYRRMSSFAKKKSSFSSPAFASSSSASSSSMLNGVAGRSSSSVSVSVAKPSRASMISLMPSTCDVLAVSEQWLLLDKARLEVTHFYDSCKKIIVLLEQHLGEERSMAKVPTVAVSTVRPEKRAALEELDRLGERWKADEFELYEMLSVTPVTKLNDVRIRLTENIKRTIKTTESWQKEHAELSLGQNDEQWVVPEYARSKVMHTFPGSSVIVREDEPSSIIANALCCKEYLTMLSRISNHENDAGAFEQAPEPPKKDIVLLRPAANTHLVSTTIAPPTKTTTTKMTSTRPALRNSHSDGSTLNTRKSGSSDSGASTMMASQVSSTNDSTMSPGEDDDEEEEEEGEDDTFLVVDGYQTNVKYVQVGRLDLSSLLLSPNGTMSSTRNTIGLTFGGGAGRNTNKHHGTMASSFLGGVVDKKSTVSDSRAGTLASPTPRPASMVVMTPRNGQSVFSPNDEVPAAKKGGYLTVKGGGGGGTGADSGLVMPASSSTSDLPSATSSSSTITTTTTATSPSTAQRPSGAPRSRSSFGYHAFASGLSGSIKGLSSLSDKFGRGFTMSSSQMDRLGVGSKDEDEKSMNETLAEQEQQQLDEGQFSEGEMRIQQQQQQQELRKQSPHIKVRHAHGQTSFSCTVYFAAEFDTLRRRCGIHEHYVQSLARCAAWNASGGKSKSSFYKTKDDRFVVKQMISSWNMAEKDELLKFAPKYFEYMEKTQESPTVLAKIFGFYSFKIKNGNADKSEKVYKIDVLIMENLFYKQKITRTFDLKGIHARHAASKANTKAATTGEGAGGGEGGANGGGGGRGGGHGATTLWDGDFIEGQFKALLLLYSHSKKIIRESLNNDTEFLANANIMDYSLLVGVDDERKELVVGIVDFIGAYTWYKRIESKGKTTLRGAKDSVTVLPPHQYRTRFRQAMEQYFLAVPDKWSKNTTTTAEDLPTPMTENGISGGSGGGGVGSRGVDVPETIKSHHHQQNSHTHRRRPKDAVAMPSPIPEGSREDSARMKEVAGATTIVVSPPSKTAGSAAAAAAAPGSIPVSQATALSMASGAKGVAKKVLQQHATEEQQEHFQQQLKIQKLPRVFYPLEV